MKFLHVSDLHIGLKLVNVDLYEDQQYILKQIVEACREQKPDAILIAGDIYDKSIPSAEAVGLFDAFISELAIAVPEMDIMMISGNHDSAQRIDLYRSVLSARGIHAIGLPPASENELIHQVTLTDSYGPVHFYLLPFVKPSMVKQITGVDEKGNNLSYDAALHALIEREAVNRDERNVIVSHQYYVPADGTELERADSELQMIGNIDAVKADCLLPFDYAALGHIHKPSTVGSDRICYSGTPLPYSLSEAGQEKGIMMVELLEKGSVSISKIPLTPLRAVRKIRGTLSEVLRESCEDYVTVVLTDDRDLDMSDVNLRLRHAFPNLLNTERETRSRVNYDAKFTEEAAKSVYELCSEFLPGLSEEEQALLQEVINQVQEVQA